MNLTSHRPARPVLRPQAQPITRETALENAGQTSAHSVGEKAQVLFGSKDTTELGFSL